ncbi:MAG: hypothetical protein FWF68_02595 [Spirochaetes bacterium]|nr:hypothetical protein [Spirochaetota bacterium]
MNIFFVVSIICFAFCLIMFFYLKWYIKNRASIDGLGEHRKEVAQLIGDINSVTDRNIQLVEDSISKLKKILEDTEKRIEEYKNIEIKQSSNVLYTNLGRGIRSALKNPEGQPPSPPVPQLGTESSLKSRQLSLELPSGELYKTPVKTENKTTVKAETPIQKPPSKKQIRNAIDSLVNEGLSPEEIASRLEISIAQVNFALNLRKSKR